MSAAALDPAAPPNAWIAFASEVVTVECSALPISIGPREAVFAPGVRFRLTAVPRLDPEPVTDAGVAAKTRLEVHGKLDLRFGDGTASLDYGEASLETLGAAIRLDARGESPTYDPASDSLLFPAAADRSGFPTAAQATGQWVLQGETQIADTALGFPLCRLSGPPEGLGAADRGPAAWLRLDAGLRIEAASIRDDAGDILPFITRQAIMLARTGELLDAAEPARAPGSVERLKPGWKQGEGRTLARSLLTVDHSTLSSIEL